MKLVELIIDGKVILSDVMRTKSFRNLKRHLRNAKNISVFDKNGDLHILKDRKDFFKHIVISSIKQGLKENNGSLMKVALREKAYVNKKKDNKYFDEVFFDVFDKNQPLKTEKIKEDEFESIKKFFEDEERFCFQLFNDDNKVIYSEVLTKEDLIRFEEMIEDAKDLLFVSKINKESLEFIEFKDKDDFFNSIFLIETEEEVTKSFKSTFLYFFAKIEEEYKGKEKDEKYIQETVKKVFELKENNALDELIENNLNEQEYLEFLNAIKSDDFEFFNKDIGYIYSQEKLQKILDKDYRFLVRTKEKVLNMLDELNIEVSSDEKFRLYEIIKNVAALKDSNFELNKLENFIKN